MADSSLQSLLHCLDPISLLRSHNPDSESFSMERGPRYRAYAELRESRLRARTRVHEPELLRVSTPPRKQVKFQAVTETTRRKASGSVVAQSVPDFASVLRKENRKPPPMAALLEMTPPGKSPSKSKTGNVRGSKSASAAAAARRSCANMEELKGFSVAAANAIAGESRRGAGIGKRPVLGYRSVY